LGVYVFHSKRTPEPLPPERPVVSTPSVSPLVTLPPVQSPTPEPDASPVEEEDPAEPGPEKRGGGGGGGGKQGTMDAAETNRFINANFSQVRVCYERRLKVNPLLEGSLDLKIRLTPKGSVGSVSVNSDTVRDGEMLECVLRTIRGWKFPAPEDGWVVFDKSFRFQKKD